MSLRWRLALILGGAVIGAVTAAAVSSFLFTSRELRAEVDDFLTRRALVVAGVEAFDVQVDPRGGRRPRVGRAPVVIAEFDALVQIIGEEGDRQYRLAEGPDIPIDEVDRRVAARGGEPVYRDVEIRDTTYRMVTFPLSGGGAAQVARDFTETESVITDLRNRHLLVGMVGALAAAIIGWGVARRTVAPVEQLTRAAEHVAATQDLTAPIDVQRTDEVGRLARSFNTMLSALETSRRQQHRLVMDASHELRTPLTSVRTNIELLQRGDPLPDDERKELLGDVNAELEELTTLVAELVELATDRREDEPVEVFRLDEIAERVAERSRRRTGRVVDVRAGESPALGRPQMLERALTNLVDNAHKWSPPDAPIEITVSGGTVTVRDHGPGIPEEDLPFVFDRFYRAPEARSRPGSGLGLAIVKQIIEAHDGEVVVGEAEGGGAAVGFRLPPYTDGP